VRRRYEAGPTTDDATTDGMSVPDAVNVGHGSDTYFTDVTVNGLKHADGRNVTVSFGDGLVSCRRAAARFCDSCNRRDRSRRRTRRSAGTS